MRGGCVIIILSIYRQNNFISKDANFSIKKNDQLYLKLYNFFLKRDQSIFFKIGICMDYILNPRKFYIIKLCQILITILLFMNG